jgi:hypothetical protein
MTGHIVKNSQGYVVGIADNIPLSHRIKNAQSFRLQGGNSPELPVLVLLYKVSGVFFAFVKPQSFAEYDAELRGERFFAQLCDYLCG